MEKVELIKKVIESNSDKEVKLELIDLILKEGKVTFVPYQPPWPICPGTGNPPIITYSTDTTDARYIEFIKRYGVQIS